jgi:head-tail adaptor
MRAGAYNKRITISRKTSVKDEFGALKSTYEEIKTTWANVQYLTGNRIEDNKEIFYTKQVKFTVRSYVDIVDEDRINYKSGTYRIITINDKSSDTTYNEKEIITELINK